MKLQFLLLFPFFTDASRGSHGSLARSLSRPLPSSAETIAKFVLYSFFLGRSQKIVMYNNCTLLSTFSNNIVQEASLKVTVVCYF